MPSVSRHFSVRTCSQHDADLTTLQQISQQTFLETFADVKSPENMSRYLTENISVDKLRTELSNEDSTFCFLEADPNVIGYLKINIGSAQTENKYERSLEIERIYVLGSYQGQGTGKILLDHALEMARSMHAEFVWLGVWEHNHRAIGFYRKHGFVEFSRHVFRLGDDEQIDILMRISLHPDPAG
jgi:ribosomal protein S18 acetylase RimI-like enzyme